MKKPCTGTRVKAVLRHWFTHSKCEAELVSVDEDDCDWRTADDNSELSYDWNVVSWTTTPDQTVTTKQKVSKRK